MDACSVHVHGCMRGWVKGPGVYASKFWLQVWQSSVPCVLHPVCTAMPPKASDPGLHRPDLAEQFVYRGCRCGKVGPSAIDGAILLSSARRLGVRGLPKPSHRSQLKMSPHDVFEVVVETYAYKPNVSRGYGRVFVVVHNNKFCRRIKALEMGWNFRLKDVDDLQACPAPLCLHCLDLFEGDAEMEINLMRYIRRCNRRGQQADAGPEALQRPASSLAQASQPDTPSAVRPRP